MRPTESATLGVTLLLLAKYADVLTAYIWERLSWQ